MKEHAKVLVVDDDAVVGRSFDRVLTPMGYEVSTAQNGKDALQQVGKAGYDLVFADIKMPGMDGIEVARRIKEMNPWLPVVMVTGYGTEDNEMKASEVGVSAFLRKPVSPQVIEWITEKTLRESQESQAQASTSVQEQKEMPLEAARVEEKESVAKNVALFFAAPFIGLAYMIAFPFVGFAALAKWGWRAMANRHPS